MKWRKELWGIKFTGAPNDTQPMLIGFAWHDMNRSRLYYRQEPTRCYFHGDRHPCFRCWLHNIGALICPILTAITRRTK